MSSCNHESHCVFSNDVFLPVSLSQIQKHLFFSFFKDCAASGSWLSLIFPLHLFAWDSRDNQATSFLQYGEGRETEGQTDRPWLASLIMFSITCYFHLLIWMFLRVNVLRSQTCTATVTYFCLFGFWNPLNLHYRNVFPFVIGTR